MERGFARNLIVILAVLFCLPYALAQGTGVHVTLRSNADPFPAYQSYAGIWGDGNYAYIGSERRNGVLIYDVSNPDSPVLVGTYAPTNPDSFDMEDIKVANGIGYFADNFGTGLHIVDVSDPTNPTLISQITSANGGYDKTHKVAVWQNFVFIPQNLVSPALIKVFDVSNPASPVLFTTITATDSQWVNDLDIQTTTSNQTRMYTAGWNDKGDIWDITNLATSGAVLLGSFKDGTMGSSVSATDDGNYLAYSRKTTDGTSEVKIWNITNPAVPVLTSTITMSAFGIDAVAPHDPKIMGNLLYVSWFQAGTLIFDITNPAAPVLMGSYDTYPGVVSPGQLDGNWGVYPYLGQDRVLLSDRNTGLYVVDATGVSSQPALYNLHVLPSAVGGGSSSTGTVYLVGLAGTGGVVVTTSSDNSAAVPPPNVTVPQNGTSASFTITTTPVNNSTTANISAAYSGTTLTAPLTITPVADFTLALGPSQLTLFPGQSGTFDGTVTSVAGYNSPVNLSCTGSAPPTCSFSPSTVTPTTGGAPFTLTVSSNTTTDYSFNAHAVGTDSKNTTHDIAASLSVVDFTLGPPSPASITEFPGTNSQFTVVVGAAGSFSGIVDLSCNAPAAGITCSFSPSASLSPTSGNPITVTVTVSSTTATPPGQYTLTVSANSANSPAPKTQNVGLNVVDFTLGTPSPISVTAFPGTTAQFSMQVDALDSFSGTVSLSCNAPAIGIACNFAPSASINPTSTNPVQVTVTVTTTKATPSSQYDLQISASSSGAPTQVQHESLTVSDFSLSAATTSQAVAAGQTASFQLDIKSLAGSFPDSVALSCSGLPALSSCTFSPSSLTPGASGGSATLSIATTAAIASAQTSHSPNVPLYALYLPMAGFIFAGPGFRRRRKLKMPQAFLLLALLALSSVLVGCGGGSAGGGGGPQAKPGTSSGTYPITITATSGSLTHSTTVTLTVQ